MASITIRDLPDSVLEKVRILSKKHRRSMNSELLLLIERGLEHGEEWARKGSGGLPPEMQSELWLQLAGSWEDDRSTEEIIEEIYASRTKGRPVSL